MGVNSTLQWPRSLGTRNSVNGLPNNGRTCWRSMRIRLSVSLIAFLTRFARFYVNNNPVIIKSKPSAKLSESLEASEKARIAAQKQALGTGGLEKVAKLLENAKKENEKPIPSEIFTSFPVPDVKSISWIPVRSVRNDPSAANSILVQARNTDPDELEEHVRKDGKDLPFFVHFSDVKVCVSDISSNRELRWPAVGLRQHCSIHIHD